MKFNRRVLAGVVAVGLIFGTASVAHADNLEADGDTATAVENVVFGEVCAGDTVSRNIALSILRSGNYGSTNVFKESSEVRVAWVGHANHPGASAIALTPTSASPGTIAIPTNWSSQNNGLTAGPITGSVAVTFRSDFTGAASGSMTWIATGVRGDNSRLDRTDTIFWTATVKDCTAPTDTAAPNSDATASTSAGDYTAGAWTNENVTVALSADDGVGSGVKEIRYTTDGSTPSKESGSIYTSPVTVSGEGTTTIKFLAVDNADNAETAKSFVVRIDKTAPTISKSAVTADDSSYTPGTWTNQDVTVSFTCADNAGGSDVATDTVAGATVDAEGGDGSVSNTGDCVDNAGNPASSQTFGPIKIDKTAPAVAVTGADDGAIYYSARTIGCTTTDPLSGVKTQATPEVQGGPLGPISATCSGAADNAGNTGQASISFTMKERTSAGYKSPVRLGETVVNQVKGGSTVPLKFEVFENDGTATTELVDASILRFSVLKYSCDGTDSAVAVEEYATAGSTALRYDAIDGQFVQNWKTPTTKGCYRAAMQVANGPLLTAQFQVK